MAYSRCGLTNPLYRGTNISFVRHVNDLFMKYSILLALLAVLRTLADEVNAEFTVIPRSLIFSHFVISLPSASSWLADNDTPNQRLSRNLSIRQPRVHSGHSCLRLTRRHERLGMNPYWASIKMCCVFTNVEVTCTHAHRHMGRNRINMHAFKCRPLITIYFPNQLRRLMCLLALGYYRLGPEHNNGDAGEMVKA